ncbi:tRNA (adenosine(37)-N6)-threonylcarbamoyltransferase complex ATPase subunit type 1 TsaE [Silvibacterium dinghuense]|uniref:tRNA threonylcarbamoyladenosine biosynthesis protein TsaE n=1 Tax=Silvibacterium dinghuense TaxID=1560006 RepID=A0A4Q1SIB5_9BACT|nr:tRNA (adenosine(37)-N6)-threonylcarbamoyltransferase complex ATPase subunit type 1 TsaE [Silvibacterium dinghuense]RXS97119.1 tRNA (adenosine(37)-N6)-threonylcarbamoyltransferase complex ATPase subunit type 1 TsaE [Silvibacterium dinghuense]GGG96410.1 tRNA (adenosine(37)-N6)-threonylcarbamoyltransferase complex ATPase subunit type 1 TsaE [Silvibacterium dinghuense]
MTTTEKAKAEAVGKAEAGKTYEFTTTSAAETIATGHKIAELLAPPKFLILRGDLGAGKTTLVKGIAEALDAAEPDEVTSPTFTLVHEYEGTQGAAKTPVNLYHLDLYRIEGERQLDTLGLDDLAAPDSIVLVEWGEKFPSVKRRSDGEIVMTSAGGDTRKIVLTLK